MECTLIETNSDNTILLYYCNASKGILQYIIDNQKAFNHRKNLIFRNAAGPAHYEEYKKYQKKVSAIKLKGRPNTRIYCKIQKRRVTRNGRAYTIKDIVMVKIVPNKDTQKLDKKLDSICNSIKNYEYEI